MRRNLHLVVEQRQDWSLIFLFVCILQWAGAGQVFELLKFEEGGASLSSLSLCKLTVLLQEDSGVAGNEWT